MSSQEMRRTTRKSLRILQHTATNSENLVGRSSKKLKQQLTQEPTPEVGDRRKNVCNKEIQVNLEQTITANDLTDPNGPSPKYWEILAKKREIALEESFEENAKLRKVIEDLKEEIGHYRQMLEEANSFVEVIKEELLEKSKDDTGIDVNDVSQCDIEEDIPNNGTEGNDCKDATDNKDE